MGLDIVFDRVELHEVLGPGWVRKHSEEVNKGNQVVEGR